MQANGEIEGTVSQSLIRTGVKGKIGTRRFAANVLISIALAGLQLLLLPLFLSPKQFAIAVLAISVTQGAVAIGDLGLLLVSRNVVQSKSLSEELRLAAFASMWVILPLASLLIFVITLPLAGLELALVMSAGCITALALASDRVRVVSAELHGAEARAGFLNVIWQNSPKVGLVALAPAGSAALSVLGGLASALVLGRPVLPTLDSFRFARRHLKHMWFGLIIVSSSFALQWIDGYAVAVVLGLTDAGTYQIVARLFIAPTYLYLPLGSLMIARISQGGRAPYRRALIATTCVCVASYVFIAAFLIVLAPSVWPRQTISLSLILPLAFASYGAAISFLSGSLLLALGKRIPVLVANVLGAALLIPSAAIGAVYFGAGGAAVASAAIWILVGAIQAVFAVGIEVKRKAAS
jgi:O-antigen/teichoic acid export membrane protein